MWSAPRLPTILPPSAVRFSLLVCFRNRCPEYVFIESIYFVDIRQQVEKQVWIARFRDLWPGVTIYLAFPAAKMPAYQFFLLCSSLTAFRVAFPMRMGDVVRKMVDALRARRLPIFPSTLSPSSLFSIFSTP